MGWNTRLDAFEYSTSNKSNLLELKLDKEKRSILKALLSLSLIHPFQVENKLDLNLFERLFTKLGLTMKADLEMRNKNPLIPYCEWMSRSIGQDIGYNSPMCDQFKPIYTEMEYVMLLISMKILH